MKYYTNQSKPPHKKTTLCIADRLQFPGRENIWWVLISATALQYPAIKWLHLSPHLITVIISALTRQQWHKVLRCRRRRTHFLSKEGLALVSACSNTCYLPATRLFQLPVCMSNKLQCLLAQQNIIKRTLDFGCVGGGKEMSDKWRRTWFCF